MATPEAIRLLARPSTLLGCLLFGVLFVFFGFLIWRLLFLTATATATAKLRPEALVVAAGVTSAMCGWIIAGMITLRNSIRQHTKT